ncbi:MAG: hypothetical protein ACLQVY_10280 [Limisphaerales bacterium]
MKASNKPDDKQPFPTFASLAEAEAYSDKTGDAYFEICYHLEGKLNLCLNAIHDLYANAPSTKRQKMQTGLVREIICPEGWPKHPETLVCTLACCGRFRHEDTCHAYTVNEALTAFVLEKQHDGTLHNVAFDRRTFEPITSTDTENARSDLLRLCDWIESRLHYGTHSAWYGAPDCFSDDPDKVHLANIGIAERHLATFSDRDRKCWQGIHERAAAKHQGDLKAWGTVGKVQHDPDPRTWTHPAVDTCIIGLWPLVDRYNWTYSDLLKVLDRLLPAPLANEDRKYPLDSEASLKMHCRSICGLSKNKKGKSADTMPEGWTIAEKLFSPMGK